jgi:hypothetical protein
MNKRIYLPELRLSYQDPASAIALLNSATTSSPTWVHSDQSKINHLFNVGYRTVETNIMNFEKY